MKNLTYKIENSYIGFLNVDETDYVGGTYQQVVNHLLDNLKEGGLYESIPTDFPKSTFYIYVSDGTFDQWDCKNYVELYKLSCAQIRKFKKLGVQLTF